MSNYFDIIEYPILGQCYLFKPLSCTGCYRLTVPGFFLGLIIRTDEVEDYIILGWMKLKTTGLSKESTPSNPFIAQRPLWHPLGVEGNSLL